MSVPLRPPQNTPNSCSPALCSISAMTTLACASVRPCSFKSFKRSDLLPKSSLAFLCASWIALLVTWECRDGPLVTLSPVWPNLPQNVGYLLWANPMEDAHAVDERGRMPQVRR